MISYFNCMYQSYVSGGGNSSNWMKNATDTIRLAPKYLMSRDRFSPTTVGGTRLKIGLRDITNNTNERTFIASVIPNLPCGNTLPTLTLKLASHKKYLILSSWMSSLVMDYVTRVRMTGIHLNYFVLKELPIPSCASETPEFDRLELACSSLVLAHRTFAPEWLKLKQDAPELASKEWKHWWAVTEADRLRLRVEIDALCADLYGLDPDDFDWIVRDDPTDSKGFYRVDRKLPFRERLTGLAAAAFRALKEGKWSAETAASLSNDEFFDLLGIPELTNAQAAHAKGLPGPLIEKRDGCHVWKPENFPERRSPPRLDLGRLLERCRRPPRKRGGSAAVRMRRAEPCKEPRTRVERVSAQGNEG